MYKNDVLKKFNNWQEKYLYILKMGKKMPYLSKKLRSKKNKLKNCISNVWIIVKKNNIISIQADSDSLFLRGILYFIRKIFLNYSLEKINLNNIFNQLIFFKNLSYQRKNGIISIIKKILFSIK